MAKPNQFRTGPAFTVHVPCHPFGTDPSQTSKALGQPAPTRQTSTFQWITRGGGRGVVGRQIGQGAGLVNHLGAQATITCVFAQLVMGSHVIKVGKYTLRPGIDFAAGSTDDTLADNLAAAIDAFPEFSAPNPAAAAVLVTTRGAGGDDHTIEVLETAPGSAFVLSATSRTGFMDLGEPSVSAPIIA